MENNKVISSFVLQDGSTSVTVPDSLERGVVLYFMRAAVCPQCNRHARELEQLKAELSKNNLDTIIIVPEDVETANKVKDRNNLTMSVMAGNGAAHALAGLDKKLLGLIQQSGTVVIDKAGKVLYKRVATNPENSFNGKEFKEFLLTL